MPAEVESMFSVREMPWHGLGYVPKKHPRSITEALKWSGLDWEVVQAPVKVAWEGRSRELEGYYVNIRSDTGDPLGVVTERYTPVQNRAAFEFLAGIFGTDMLFETAGSLMNGRRAWVMMKLPDFVEVGGDPIGQYAFISNSHDGKSSVLAAMTPVRIVCANTLGMAVRRAKGMDAQRTYNIRHLGNMSQKIQEARNVLDVTVNYYEQFAAVGDKLALAKCSDRKADTFLSRLFPTDDLGDRAVENRKAAREAVKSLFKGTSPVGDTTGNAPGTFWCLYNAASEYADWQREERKEGGRFQRSLDDPDGLKKSAWDLTLDAAGVSA